MITIRATIRRFPRTGGTPNGEPWIVVAYTQRDTTDPGPDTFEATWCATITDAISAALDMREQLARQLMDEVHESRARRRDATEHAGCVATQIPACTHTDPHTLEPTA